MKYAQWNIPRSTPPAAEVLQDAGFSPLLAAVLSVRGFSDPQEAKNFLESSEVYLGDPLMMTDMPQAVMRLSRAIAAGEMEKARQLLGRRYFLDPVGLHVNFISPTVWRRVTASTAAPSTT